MKKSSMMRLFKAAASGAILFQMTGCDTTGFFDVVNTVLLSVTAAGSVAILQNI